MTITVHYIDVTFYYSSMSTVNHRISCSLFPLLYLAEAGLLAYLPPCTCKTHPLLSYFPSKVQYTSLPFHSVTVNPQLTVAH